MGWSCNAVYSHAQCWFPRSGSPQWGVPRGWGDLYVYQTMLQIFAPESSKAFHQVFPYNKEIRSDRFQKGSHIKLPLRMNFLKREIVSLSLLIYIFIYVDIYTFCTVLHFVGKIPLPALPGDPGSILSAHLQLTTLCNHSSSSVSVALHDMVYVHAGQTYIHKI